MGKRSLLVGTLNVRSMQRQEKLEYILEGCRRRGLAVLLAQETFLGENPGLVIPAPWALHSAPHPTMRGRRGLAILVNQQLIGQLGWRATRVADASTDGHDLLAVRVGPWMMVSVYVPCTGPNHQTITSPDYERVVEDIAALKRDAGDQLLVGGDWNGGGRHEKLDAAMAEVLALHPLLKPPLVTRPSPSRPTEGNLLDNLYCPEDSAAALSLLEPFEAVEGLAPLQAHDSDDAEPLWVQDVSDHLLVAARIPTPGMVLPEENGGQPRPKPERRIRWKKLDELERVARRGDEPARSDAKAKLKAMGDRIAAIETSDLAEANDQFLAICREELGTYQPREGPKQPFMTHPAVKTALRKCQKARKRFDRARHKGLPALVQARLQGLANAAHRQWQQERDEAIRATAEAYAGRMAEGGTDSFFRRYQSARGVKRRLDPTRHLDPTATAAFWAGILSSTAPPITERAPYCDETDVTITIKMVREAIKQMTRSSAGPDGLDFRLFRRFAGQLAEVLARCFTTAVAQGMPDGLRRSATLLFPKGGGATADPADYRPITLLPMAVRILHKVLDNLFRAAMYPSPEAPQPLFQLQRTQAGFMPGRNTYEQAALLQLVQSIFKEGSAGSARQLLCGIFLDIRKAFDSMEYGQLLDILESRHRFPRQWLEILRRFLPGNSTTIMGITVFFMRGLPQGGALCPLLCDLFMDDLACELADYLEQHPRLGPLWRTSQTRDGYKWDLPKLKSLWLRLIQFADDIALLAATPAEAQELLTVVADWGKRRALEFSPKSFAVVLSRPTGQWEALPELRVGELPLAWAPEDKPFRYLGVTTQAATSHRQLQGKSRAALKEDKARRCLNALRAMSRITKGKHLAAPAALRRGIEQVVYAGALYDTAIIDTDYEKLDRMVTSTMAQILQVPPTTPSAFLRWELRLWDGELRAHKRALHLAAQLWHQSWIGKEILKPYLLEREHRDHHDPAGHPFFKIGPQARLLSILNQYGYDWARVGTSLVYSDDEKAKARLSEKLSDLIAPRFASGAREKALATKGMPEHHRLEMLDHMAVPPPEQERDGLPLPEHVRHDLPLYLYLGGDLPRAGVWTRMPYLRLQRRGEELRRADCAWCRLPEKEHGHHLLTCCRMPGWLRRRRDRVLRLILEDVRRSKTPPEPHENATCYANMQRLFHLYWPGKGSWLKGSKSGPSRRADCGQQPDREVLTKALWYMRTMINEYRKATAGTGPGGANPVWELPVYGHDPDPEPEQGSGATSEYEEPPALCDSLWLLGSPDE